jgi:PIN domain nuclease of toxin-antitoxin system
VSNIVLDASAALAMLLNEPGGDRVFMAVAAGTDSVSVSAVNWCEILTRLQRDNPATTAQGLTTMLPGVEVVPFDLPMAAQAAEYARYLQQISLGDRACLALAKRLGASAWTADRMWATLPLDVQIEMIR